MPELRVLRDPVMPAYEWRMNDLQLEFRYNGFGGVGHWFPLQPPSLGTDLMERTPARLSVWRELFLHPV